nr:peptide chain release factor N(5)-glutamine methyltransferase [Staphylococcus lutrae]
MQWKGYEATSVKWLIMDTLQWSSAQAVMHEMDSIPEKTMRLLDERLLQLLSGRPVQYVVGQAAFYGRQFKVTPDVLIPRPETEEVVQYFLSKMKQPGTVADIGVGSGAIAVTLKAENEALEVIATDISAEALEVARDNARAHQQHITFYEGDALQPLINNAIRLDGLISNPPYIGVNEREWMDAHVIAHEPHVALFADNEGFQVYESILRDLPKVMREGAPVVFEIGFQQGKALTTLMASWYPHIATEVLEDINGNARMFYFNWTSSS